MTRSYLATQECCSWCQHPISECRSASCDQAGTYTGVMVRGRWVELPHVPASAIAAEAAADAGNAPVGRELR